MARRASVQLFSRSNKVLPPETDMLRGAGGPGGGEVAQEEHERGAIRHLGACYMDGDHGLEKDMSRAVELFERAAELGFKEAHFELATIFNEDMDDSGIAKDMVRAVEHYEIAAKQGHVTARHNLGVNDSNAGNCDLALKHWMISAKLGSAGSLNAIKDLYTKGLASKSDYAGALRGYHDAVTEMSSPERDNVMKIMRDGAKA